MEEKMKSFDKKKIKINNKLALIIGSILMFCIILVVSLISINTLDIKENTLNSVENKTTWQSDSQEKYLIDKIKYKHSFLDFYNVILEYAQDNLFAKEIKEKTDKFNYPNLPQADKDILEVYINEMFKIIDTEVSKNDINNKKINKAYWTDFTYLSSVTNATFYNRLLYISFEDDPNILLAYRFDSNNTIFNATQNTFNGTLTDGLKVYFSEDGYGNNWTLYNENKKETVEITIKELDSNSLQQMIINSNDLLSFLKQYRDEVYKPIKDKQLQKEAEEKKEYQEKENKIKSSIPQVGMTPSEVRKTKWGSPDKINKDTYSWGTTEQWVYNKYGYVYFRNGVVSSVSER